MCFASCSQYEHGWFSAYRSLAEDWPDLVLHLGNYQYEYPAGQYVAPSGNVRDHVGPLTATLASYRQRYAQYKTDPDLQAAHAAAPWLVVFDDHELAEHWAAETPAKPQPSFLDQRAWALRAYYENMPLRRRAVPDGIHMQLYRRVPWVRWRRSTCSTPASTGACSPAGIGSGPTVVAEPIPSDRSPARIRSVGSSTGSGARRRAGICWASRCSSRSWTSNAGRAAASIPTRGTATSATATASLQD